MGSPYSCLPLASLTNHLRLSICRKLTSNHTSPPLTHLRADRLPKDDRPSSNMILYIPRTARPAADRMVVWQLASPVPHRTDAVRPAHMALPSVTQGSQSPKPLAVFHAGVRPGACLLASLVPRPADAFAKMRHRNGKSWAAMVVGHT